MDILSGSWPGELYFFKGLGGGKFAAGAQIKDNTGKPIKLDSASTVFACDWTGDGNLDLLVGSIEGHVFLVPNEGTTGKPAFGKGRKLEAAGKTILIRAGDTHPIASDWDADGKLDLLVGTGDGSVLFYRNTGSTSSPALGPPQTLVPASSQSGSGSAEPGSRGIRAKICVADWNGDGKQDLLVGDFSMGPSPSQPPLSPAEKANRDRLQKRIETVMKPYEREMEKIGPPPRDDAGRQMWQRRISRMSERYSKKMQSLRSTYAALRRYYREPSTDGFVWVVASPQVAASK